MAKILCINRGMLFQGFLFSSVLNNHFDEVHLAGQQCQTTYGYPMDPEKFGSYLKAPAEIKENLDNNSYDCILGLEQASLLEILQIKGAYQNLKAIFGLHVLDYPLHILRQRERTNTHNLWGIIASNLNAVDFIAHNQKIAIELLKDCQSETHVEWVPFPVNTMGKDTKGKCDFIFYSGRLSKDKGIHYVLSALSTLKEKIPFWVVGGGYDYSQIAEHLDVDYNHVENCSEEHKWQLYRDARFTVCGADNPYIPAISVLEGISVGTTGIVFDYHESNLHYKEFAFYCIPRNIESMARTIKYLWEDPQMANSRAAKGPEWTQKECSYEKWAQRIYSMYKRTKAKL